MSTFARMCSVGVVALLVAACSPEHDRKRNAGAGDASATPAPETAAAAASSTTDTSAGADTAAQWARSCALCHVNGEGGAPTLGDTEAWAARLEQGEEVLLTHTIEGYNNMPPLGYCMDCERDDFVALIRFMAATL